MDAILILVPTPLNDHQEPDLSYRDRTVASIAPWLREASLLFSESTTIPAPPRGLSSPCLWP